MKIAVCDDEGHFRKRIRQILLNYMEQKGLPYDIDEFASGKEFTELGIEMLKYEIVFLDISMDGMTGMQTAEKMREAGSDAFLVFVTVFVDFAMDGYKVSAIRYIVKNNHNMEEQIRECMDEIRKKMNSIDQKKTIEFVEGTKNIVLNHLLYIESRLHVLSFYIMEDDLNVYTKYGTLNGLETEFADSGFVRIHQSYLVNMMHIERLERYEVRLNNGIRLGIPRKRYNQVEKIFIIYKGAV